MKNNIFYTYFKKKYITNKFIKYNRKILVLIVNKNLNKITILNALNNIFQDKVLKINSLIQKKNNKKQKKIYITFKKECLYLNKGDICL